MINNRVVHFDALKSVACFLVFLGHFYYGFYTSCTSPLHLNNIISLLHQITYLLTNGVFTVSVFCFISGYFSKNNIEKMGDVCLHIIKRYLRFTIPLIIICVSIYITGLLTNDFKDSKVVSELLGSKWIVNVGGGEKTLLYAFKMAFIGIPFLGRAAICSPLWAIKPLFLGHVFIIVSSWLDYRTGKKYSVFIYSLLVIISGYMGYSLLAVILGGLYKKYCMRKQTYNIKVYIISFILIFVLFIGNTRFYDDIFFTFGKITFSELFKCLLACLTVVCINQCNTIKRYISSNKWLIIGKISFPFYLLHMIVVCTFSCKMILLFYNTVNHTILYIVTEVISFFITFILSYLWMKYLDTVIIKFIDKIMKNTSKFIMCRMSFNL